MSAQSSCGLHLFVDRIEEGIAVLLSSGPDIEIAVPTLLLPEDISEGDWLVATFERDDVTHGQVRREIDGLMEQLGDDP